ncbi:MAG: SAF domain-containing protein, partial [Patescibacteria group bacterium]
ALQATRDILKGDVLQEGHNLGILRPGKQPQGVHPKYLSKISGRRASRFISAGRGVRMTDVR